MSSICAENSPHSYQKSTALRERHLLCTKWPEATPNIDLHQKSNFLLRIDRLVLGFPQLQPSVSESRPNLPTTNLQIFGPSSDAGSGDYVAEGGGVCCGLGGGGGGGGAGYPERPGEADCNYYLRTGSCGYGDRCRYNHPRDRSSVVAGAVRSGASEYPERVGQPACQFFLKTGTCKYGSTCKYDHPRQGDGSARLVSLNYLGYPLRVGEKECTYYLRTGQCKFGSTCKFHHPQPTGGAVSTPPQAFYPSMQAPSVHSPTQYPNVDVARSSVLAAPYMPYGPMLVSPGMVPVPGWTPYPVGVEFSASVSAVVSPGGSHTMRTGTPYGSSNQLSPSAPAYQGPYTTLSSAAGPSSSQKDSKFPDRPGQPECQFYMRTGDCKFGSTCKYHHPPERSTPETNCVLSPFGLPMRPGAPPCVFYAQHGVCKFGPTCKFDHPLGTLRYSPSASSLTDMPVAPYPVGFSLATLAPSLSSSELQPEFIPNKDAFTVGMPSSEGTSTGFVGSIFSRGSYIPHTLGQLSVPTSVTSSSSGSTGLSGKVPSSS